MTTEKDNFYSGKFDIKSKVKIKHMISRGWRLIIFFALLASISLASAEPLQAQGLDEDLEAFRSQLASYMSDLQEVNSYFSSFASDDLAEEITEIQQELSGTQQMISEMTPEQLAEVRDALPQSPEWWNLPQSLLTHAESMAPSLLAPSEPLAQSLEQAAALQSASMRPIVPGVQPACPSAPPLEALIAAKAAVRAAEVAVRVAEIAVALTPGDFVFGVIVLGEGTVQTVSPHPARVIAVIVLETAKVAVEVAKTVQFGIETAIDIRSSCLTANHQAVLHDFSEMMRMHLQVIEVKTLGCSQGFWKNHTELWDSSIAGSGALTPTYDPGTLFDDVFGPDADKAAGLRDGATLLDALQAKGNGNISQARNAVTLLLNNDALDAGNKLPCDPPVPPGDVGPFTPIVGPFVRRFLISADEAGEPVDISSIVSVHASSLNPTNLNFADVTATTTATPVKTGVLTVEIQLSFQLRDARVFQFKVAHDHGLMSIDGMHDIVHFGTILFHQEHEGNLGMGQ